MSLPTFSQIARLIDDGMLADRRRFHASLRRLRENHRQGHDIASGLAKLQAAIQHSIQTRQARQNNLPPLTFPEDLPICQRRNQILSAIATNKVVIVCGDTGSGKSTQLPKMCLSMGRGVAGLIGHTQPRRIAARSVAGRIAEELDSPLGKHVGYQVRFEEKLENSAFVKVMTDGILLAEIPRDRALLQYDTLIIDEAHERSLNVDFLLGYLKTLLPRRPDLKLIITSATIDPQRFSRYFHNAPVIEVSGRMYPVQTVYRPLPVESDDDQAMDMVGRIVQTVGEIDRGALKFEAGDPLAESSGDPSTQLHPDPGLETEKESNPKPTSLARDILVFLPGEREIRETAEALIGAYGPRLEILPLYARLALTQQQRIFKPVAGHKRRVVLATNVAETSLTVPHIGFVIDTGLARQSRYNPRTKVQRLPIEAIAQSSADQRQGRCGRVAPGVCVRLYDEADYLSRPAFTQPEILRTNLASVILQMKHLGLGEPEQFAFLEAPSFRMIQDGYQTLIELGALDARNELSEIGKKLARLPVDPRIGRMIVAGLEERCLKELLIIAAALSVQDPRERPMDQQEAADRAQATFRHESSDFLTWLKLWEAYHHKAAHLSRAKLRDWCHGKFLSFVRMREWVDVHRELEELMREESEQAAERPRDRATAGASADAIHRALLAGLLSNVGMRTQDGDYAGPRGTRFRIHPGSTLFGQKPPPWIMAAEIVQTTRLYARTVAPVRPTWIEKLARHLVGRDYFKPFWDQRSARVLGFEKVMLHGLVVEPGRQVPYGQVNPQASREVFIHQGLVEGKYHSDAAFLKHNHELVQRIRRWEHKLRKPLLAGEERRFDFYQQRIPQDVYSGQAFENWRRKIERHQPRLLFMSLEQVLIDPTTVLDETLFPDVLELDGLKLALEYRHDPGDSADGITALVPLAALAQLPTGGGGLDRLVPGRWAELVEALLRGLPKTWRTAFVPIPPYVDACVQRLKQLRDGEANQPLPGLLSDWLEEWTGVRVPVEIWSQVRLPDHLVMRFQVMDEQGRFLEAGRNLRQLQEHLGDQAATSLLQLAGQEHLRDGIVRWDFGDLAPVVSVRCGLSEVQAYPALLDAGNSASLRLLPTLPQAETATRGGVRRLLLLELQQDLDRLLKQAIDPSWQEISVMQAPWGSAAALREDLLATVIDEVFLRKQPGGPVVRTHQEYEIRLRAGWPEAIPTLASLLALVQEILVLRQQWEMALAWVQPVREAWAPSVFDMQEQYRHLLPQEFLLKTPHPWRNHLPRYLRGMVARLRKLGSGGLVRDQAAMDQFRPLWEQFQKRHRALEGRGLVSAEWMELRWWMEECRVALFAQELKTAVPMSLARLSQKLERCGL